MVAIAELWLPILLSAVFVFIVSAIFHMAIPIHKGDYRKLSGEDRVLEEIRNQGVQPGNYMFPNAESMKDLGTPEMIEKFKQGPVGWMTVIPNGPPRMGKSLVQWFLFTVLVSLFVGYTARLGLGYGTSYILVFRLTAAAAILGYALGVMNDSIWKGQRWGITLKFVFDGVVYALVTAGTFGWLWPEAS